MMNKFYRIASLLALTSVAVPAAAHPYSAAFETSADRSMSQPFMFTGATVRLSLDGRSNRRPEFAMRFAGGTTSQDVMPRIGEGIAFSAVPGAKPKLTLAGQETKTLEKRLNMSGGAKTVLIVGGVVLLVGAAALLALDHELDEIKEDCCGHI